MMHVYEQLKNIKVRIKMKSAFISSLFNYPPMVIIVTSLVKDFLHLYCAFIYTHVHIIYMSSGPLAKLFSLV